MRTVVLALIGMVLGIGCESPDGGGSSGAVPVPKANQTDSEKIEAAIRKAIVKPSGKLTKADLEKVKVLQFPANTQLTSVDGLEKLSNLNYLMLDNNRLTKLPAGLEKLTNLTRLKLSWNQLTSVAGLEKLTNLTHLDLVSNQLTSVAGLEKLTNLNRLELSFNRINESQMRELKKALPRTRIVEGYQEK